MEHTQEYIKNFSEWRNERAKAILEKGNPEVLEDNTYLVPSQSNHAPQDSQAGYHGE